MEFGKFTMGGKCYVVTTPKTPTPWKNRLFHERYFLEVSQRLCGESFLVEDFRRYPVLAEEKRFYAKVNGKVYHLFCGQAQEYRCEHHLEKTIVTEQYADFSVCTTVFVPACGGGEVWSFHIENCTEQELAVQFFACFPFANITYQSLECSFRNGCFYKKSFPYYIRYDEYEKLRQTERIAYVLSDTPTESFECSKRRYFGGDDPFGIPQMVQAGGSDQKCEYEDCVAAFSHVLTLPAKGAHTVNYRAGAEKTEAEIAMRTISEKNVQEMLENTQREAERALAPVQINTSYEDLDALVNYWAKKQLIFLATHNRGGVYCPVRNQLQDAMGYAALAPAKAWQIVSSILRKQRSDGYLKQWYTTDGSPASGLCQLDHSDGGIWLILCGLEVARLGERAWLDEKHPYCDGAEEASALEHLKKATYYLTGQLGAHGLCLMKDGDWTDPINGPGRKGRGESTWNTMALIYALGLLLEIEEDAELRKRMDALKAAVDRFCWDEDRYIVGYDDDGVPVGARTDREGNLFLNTQTWAIISGVCTPARRKIVYKTLERLKTDFGYRLLDPAFSAWNPQWGKISVKHRGNTENGSVYTHGNAFMAYAYFLSGDADRAIETLRMILPTNPNNPPSNSLQLPTFIPNYYVANVDCDFGRSSNFYGSGTPSWLIWMANRYLTDGKKS